MEYLLFYKEVFFFKNKCILGPGDIVRKNIFEKLSKVFKPKNKIKYLLIF